MPFFTIETPHMMHPQPMPHDQVETLCRQRSLDDLQSLRQRMKAFFTEKSAQRKKAIADSLAIDVQITALNLEIFENEQEIARAEARNREIMSSLPGNGAERYLALQTIYTVPSIKFSKESEIKKIQDVQKRLRQDIAWINYEFTTCDPEWKIVLKVIDEKTPKVEVTASATPAYM